MPRRWLFWLVSLPPQSWYSTSHIHCSLTFVCNCFCLYITRYNWFGSYYETMAKWGFFFFFFKLRKTFNIKKTTTIWKKDSIKYKSYVVFNWKFLKCKCLHSGKKKKNRTLKIFIWLSKFNEFKRFPTRGNNKLVKRAVVEMIF